MLVVTWTGLARTWRHGPKLEMRWTRSWLDRRLYSIFSLMELGAGVRRISFTFLLLFTTCHYSPRWNKFGISNSFNSDSLESRLFCIESSSPRRTRTRLCLTRALVPATLQDDIVRKVSNEKRACS